MLQNLFFLFCIPFFFSPFTQDWKEFKSEEGKFKVFVPGEMEKKEQVFPTEIGEIQYVTHYYQEKGEKIENHLYMVSYCDYPANSMHSDSTEVLEDFFATTLETAISSVKGELRYSDKINYLQYPGMTWRIDYLNGTATIKTKIYLVKNRFYTVQVVTERKKSLNNAADKFLNSFGLL